MFDLMVPRHTNYTWGFYLPGAVSTTGGHVFDVRVSCAVVESIHRGLGLGLFQTLWMDCQWFWPKRCFLDTAMYSDLVQRTLYV